MLTVEGAQLSSQLRSAGGDIPLLGRFTARRDTGAVISLIDQKTPLLPQIRESALVKQFRDGITGAAARIAGHWTTRSHFRLEFQDVIIEFDQEGRSIQQATGLRVAGPAGPATVYCPELLARVDHFTLESENVLDRLEPWARRLRHASDAEQLIRVLWLQGLIWLSLGQADKGLAAVAASFQAASDDAISILASEGNKNLCSDLAARLRAIGEQEKAGRVAKMVSRPC